VAVAGVGEPKAKNAVTASAIDAKNAIVGVLRTIWESLLIYRATFVNETEKKL
jgi:hypothetical protein